MISIPKTSHTSLCRRQFFSWSVERGKSKLTAFLSCTKHTIQPTLVIEGPLRIIPAEIVKYILFLTNQRENTQLVSRAWKDLAFEAIKQPTKQELKQTIRLITEQLDPGIHAQCIADLAEIQAARQPSSNYLATYVAVGQLFLVVKGLVIGAIRKLPVKEKDQLQLAIGDQLPESMKDLFKISKLTFVPSITDFFTSSKQDIFEISRLTTENVDLDTFFTLLQSCQPLSIDMRSYVVHAAIKRNNIECVKLLLANGPISEAGRDWAVVLAVCRKNIECVKLLLANGPISEEYLGRSVCRAADTNKIESAQVLLDIGPISEKHRGLAVCEAVRKDNMAFVKLLLATGPIPEEHRNEAIEEAGKNNNEELLQLLIV